MSTWDVKIGERFSGAIIDVARLDRNPATARDWDWIEEHLMPRIAAGGVILDADGALLGARPDVPVNCRTRTNPTGEVRRCDRRDLHEAHEWQADFGAYFNVYCPGNDGTRP